MRPGSWPLAAIALALVLAADRQAGAAPVDPDDVPPDEKAGEDAPPVKPRPAHGGPRARDTEGATDASDVPFARNWVNVAFQLDALVLPGARNACAGGTGYTCFGSGGGYDPQDPLPDADDLVSGGIKLATMRVLLGYDRAISPNATVGARLGYALRGGPQRPGGSAFEPLHLEARASYWFGDAPLARTGLRVYVTGALGVAEIDADVVVDVYASTAAYQAGRSQNDAAWRKTGLGFGALGLGAMVAVTPTSGVFVELRGEAMFPTTGAAASLQVGYAFGL